MLDVCPIVKLVRISSVVLNALSRTTSQQIAHLVYLVQITVEFAPILLYALLVIKVSLFLITPVQHIVALQSTLFVLVV